MLTGRARYRISERLGTGSSGSVHRAWDLELHRHVAIKSFATQAGPEKLTAASRELRTLRLIRQSTHFLALLDHFVHDDELWLVLELCEPGSLADLLLPSPQAPPLPSNHPPFPTEPLLAHVLRALLRALAILHGSSRIHRDVKAQNAFVTTSGHIKLGDLSAAAVLTSTTPQRNTTAGSPYWMAPEVISRSGYAAPADVWSLGITAIELSDGAPPLASEHPMRALFIIPKAPPPRPVNPADWSPEFLDFIAQCLQKDPPRRPTAADLLNHSFFAKYPDSPEMLTAMAKVVDSRMPRVQEARRRLNARFALPLRSPRENLVEEEDDHSDGSVVVRDDDEVDMENDSAYANYVVRMRREGEERALRSKAEGLGLRGEEVAELGEDELRARLEFLEWRELEEVNHLRAHFAAQRAPLESELQKRQHVQTSPRTDTISAALASSTIPSN